MDLTPTLNERTTVELWLPENLLGLARAYDGWHLATTSLPDGVGRTSEVKVAKIKSLDLGSIRLLSLMQGRVEVTVSAVVSISVYISADDVQASEEARAWVGDVEAGFLGAYVDFDCPVIVKLELELLKQPPMVLTAKLTGIEGASSITIKG